MAAAVKGKCAPIETATPINTTPTVPTDPHEVPVKVENITGTKNAIRYK